MNKVLRPYQQKAVKECWAELCVSDKPVLLMASVGSGKSLMIASILLAMEKAGKRALCLVNNAELVRSNRDTFNEQGGNASVYCAALGEKDASALVVFGTPQTVLNGINKNETIGKIKFNIIVVDECFPEGTLIDGIPIENIRIGQKIRSYNHNKNIIEEKNVINVSKKICPPKLCLINSSHGVIICTLEHPIYIQNKGYTQAHNINRGDFLYADPFSLHDMQKKYNDRKPTKFSIKKIRGCILRSPMCQFFSKKNNELISKNEIKQPNGKCRVKNKNDSYVKEHGSSTKNTGWKWLGIYRAAKKIIMRPAMSVGGGAFGKNWIKFVEWISPSLQNRYSKSNKKNSHRNRWQVASPFKDKKTRCEKGRIINLVRVESIEVYEQGCIRELHPSIKFNYVYNLEIEDNNNYFANGLLVHNCHMIDYANHRNCFMRILRYYKQEYADMRLLGATGTNFRFRGASIVGSHCLFRRQVGNITTEQLIDDGYLIKPQFEVDAELVLDFSNVKIKQNGQFDQKQLESVVEKSARLTELICHQVVHIMETQKRHGVFFFATTKKHAFEILSHLPLSESAIILGETPQHERTEILNKARTGEIRYLVNIAIISVGIDIPAYDTIAYLRPTESLVLLVQTMGRVLRLSPETLKENALVLDFAGNIERHRDWDNPVLLEAVKQTIDRDKPLVISCPACLSMNTEHARRCVGMIAVEDDKKEERCKYYFEFKECENLVSHDVLCGAQNDIAARLCHKCGAEIIDPNAKLSMTRVQNNYLQVEVLEARYSVLGTQKGFRVNCAYKCKDLSGKVGSVFESYSPISEKARMVFYGQFVKKHCEESSQWFMHMENRLKVEEMLRSVNTPIYLLLSKESDGTKIRKKIFKSEEEVIYE